MICLDKTECNLIYCVKTCKNIICDECKSHYKHGFTKCLICK